MHGERHQSDADAAVCEQRMRETCVRARTISYDIRPPRYRTLDESAIDIAISCNRYDHYYVCELWRLILGSLYQNYVLRY